MPTILDTFDLKTKQLEAAQERWRDVAVAAGAGSGKTRTLVARYVALLAEGHPPRAVVAVTFTQKAAREMRNRIRHAVQAWHLNPACPPAERVRWADIEADIDTARIGTIHSLCAAILRAHPAEAAVDPRFTVLDEGLAATLKAQAVDDALAWVQTQTTLLPLFQAFTVADLTACLTTLLKAAFETPLVSSALAERWQTATGRALRDFVEAPEIAAAIADLRHLQSARQLVADAGDKLAPQVDGLLTQWDRLEEALAHAQGARAALALFTLRREYSGGKVGKKGQAKEAVKLIRETYDAHLNDWLGGKKPEDVPPDPALEAQFPDLIERLGQLLTQARANYQTIKDQRQALDFDDLEAKTAQLLSLPALRTRWQTHLHSLMVDEFQDTNARQRFIVKALVGEPGRLFIVGDAKQSIYRFRGADVTVFRALNQEIRAEGGLALELNTTFRAHAALVTALNELLTQVLEPATRGADYAVPFAPLVAARAAPRTPPLAPYIEFLAGYGNAIEARPVAAQLLTHRLRELHDQHHVAWGDVALLFRASTGFPAYEAALEAAGIPFVTLAGRGFYDRPEVRDVLNLLRALADPWDDLALAGLLRSPAFGLSDVALYQLRHPPTGEVLSYRSALTGELSQLAPAEQALAQRAHTFIQDLTALIDRVPVPELLAQVLDRTHYRAILATVPHGARLQRNLDKLVADAHASGLLRVGEFLEYLENLQAAGAREGEAPTEAGGAVRLLTVHRAKGLEFPVVVLADAAREARSGADSVLLMPEFGLVAKPDRWPSPPLIFKYARAVEEAQAAAESARLLYVALTRTQEKLIISGHFSDRALTGWLGQLAAAAGVNLAQMSQKPGEWHFVTLPTSGQSVAAQVQLTLLEEGVTPAPTPPPAEPSTDSSAVALFRPLTLPASPEESSERVARHLRRITGHTSRTDGTVVGTLVHAALRRWCFPGDIGLERLLTATAKESGVVMPDDVARHLAHATELLSRFRAMPQWAEINVARQRGDAHPEIPYSHPASRGILDLLYRRNDGAWLVLDFKTDAIYSDSQLAELLATDYRAQLARYRQAATQLVGQPVQTHLVLLDYLGAVQWRWVE